MNAYIRNVSISALLLIALLALHFASPPSGGLWLRTFYDSTHIPIFGVLAIGVLSMTPVSWPGQRRFLVSLSIVALLAALSELAQVPTVRDASLRDFISDMMGGVGFLCIAMGISQGHSTYRLRRLSMLLIGFVSMTIPLIPLGIVSAAYTERMQSLPNLIRFDSRLSGLLIKMQNAELTRVYDETSGSVSASIVFGQGQWPGIAFPDIWPNWASYEALDIDIENPGPNNLPIYVRIHDRKHRYNLEHEDRFSRRIDLSAGRQTLRIDLSDVREAPAGRRMNMKQIDGLILFSTKQEAGRRLLIHKISLVNHGFN